MSRSCNKKRWLSRKLENSSRSPFSSSCSRSSSAKISGGCCQEYFVAEETSLVRASLREDRDTLSGFNGQCPLRRKFRGTLVPKFAGSHRGRKTQRPGASWLPASECQVSLRTRE